MPGRTNKQMKFFMIATALVFIGLIGGYLFKQYGIDQPKGSPVEETQLSTWIADWDWESGMEDLTAVSTSLTSLHAFAAYFDDKDSLYLREDFHQMLPNVMTTYNGSERKLYLTLVNDLLHEDGTSSQKDTELVDRLMASEESRARHVDEIMAVVEKFGFDGVEIDYEKIGDNTWDSLLVFFNQLYDRLLAKGKSLRIVLEPRAPVESLSLPEGPIYVMMAYNLYGSHGGPGPKSDYRYIKELAQRMDRIAGPKVIALAAGGFDWPDSGKAVAVNEQQATKLAGRSLEPPERDEESGSVYFRYTDGNGMKHTVWYADYLTLKGWIDTAREAGYRQIAIWRLGGLKPATLDFLRNQFKEVR